MRFPGIASLLQSNRPRCSSGRAPASGRRMRHTLVVPPTTRRGAISRVASLVVLAVATTTPIVSSAGAADPREPEPWTLGIVGASASAGFGTFIERTGTEGPALQSVDLADLVSTLAPPGTVVSDWSTSMLFHDPCRIAPRALERLLGQRPDAILAIDFLFWFAYGLRDAQGEVIVDERQRDALFEHGLSLLEDLEIPMILGDLPDMRTASGLVLSPRQVPRPETLARLNARLRQWAETRPTVRLVSLESMRRRWLGSTPDGRVPRQLQPDRLHPTFEGLVEVLHACRPAMRSFTPTVPLADALDAVPTEELAALLAARIAGAEAPSDAGAPSGDAPEPVQSETSSAAEPDPSSSPDASIAPPVGVSEAD